MKIVIHFGPPKTGTSTIQHWLTSNTNLLVENGIYYPGHKVDENGVSSGNLTALFDRVGDNFSFSHKKFKNELALAEQKGAHTLLFSSEFFMRQLSVIAEAIPEAIFLGFVRFPLETLESTYNQGVKRKANPELLTVGEKPRAPIFEIVGKAVNNIGKKRFELLPFEKSFFVEGDLVKTFLNKLDFHLDIEITRETVNSSYCFEALEVKRWFNRYHFLPILSPLDKFLQGYKKGTSHFSLIPPEKFERVKEHYLTLTREFSDQVGLVGAEEFIDKLREKSQKPYRMQQLTSDIFEAVIQDWLDGNPGAGDLLRKFVDLSAPQQPSDQVYFDTIYKLIPSSRSFSALTSALYLDRTTIKAVLNTMNVKKLSSFRRSGINKLSFTSAISKWKFDHFSSTLPVNHQVEWISHHIPKTAGSSLRNSMEQAYGMQAIYGVYRESGAAELNKGRNIWLPAEAKVIHGHFRTHKNQQQYFPNAKRLVWLRDPIERAWSLLGRLLDIKEKDQLYNKLKARYIDKGITEKADLFRAWITDDELNYPLFAYTHYFRQIGIEHFDFVGSMHSMKEDLVRLSNVLDIDLTVEHKNVRTGATDLPIEVRQLESYLAKEYAVVGKYLRNKQRVISMSLRRYSMMTIKFGIGLIPKSVRELAKRSPALTSFYSHSLQKSGLFYGFPNKKKLQELYSQTLSYQAARINEIVSNRAPIYRHYHLVVRAHKRSNLDATLDSLLIHRRHISGVTIISNVNSDIIIKDDYCAAFEINVFNAFKDWDVDIDLDQVVFVNSGDTLHPHFFDVCCREINDGLLYVDSDFLNDNRVREDARLFPDWNPALQLSSHYISTGVVLNVKASHNELKLAINRVSTIASLVNVLVNEATALAVKHIPLSLIHYTNSKTRIADELKETSGYLNEKFGAVCKINKETQILKIQWPIKKQPLVSLIIPTKNGKELVKACIESILEKTTYKNFEIILVDNNSDEPESLAYFSKLGQHPKITLLKYPHPFNYSAINNFAVSHCNGEVVGLVNNDIEVISPTWLDYMVGHVMRDDIGCVGAKLLYSDGRVQHAGVVMGYGGGAGHAHKYFPRYHPGYLNRLIASNNFSAVTAACLLVKRTHYEAVKGLNEKDLTVAFNDVDFCLKVLELGVRNLYCAEAELYHHESVSRGLDVSKEKMARFNSELAYLKAHWGHVIAHDPAYNPNLTLRHENFAIKDEKERLKEANSKTKIQVQLLARVIFAALPIKTVFTKSLHTRNSCA